MCHTRTAATQQPYGTESVRPHAYRVQGLVETRHPVLRTPDILLAREEARGRHYQVEAITGRVRQVRRFSSGARLRPAYGRTLRRRCVSFRVWDEVKCAG